MEWTVTEKNKEFTEIAGKALHGKRQRVQTTHGVVIVISEEELEQIEGEKPSLGEYLLSIPKIEEADFSRDKSLPREFEW